jgi:hypothetical protein
LGQLLNVRGVNDFRLIEMHTAQSLVYEPVCLGVETVIENLKICKSPTIDQIPAELIQAEGIKMRSRIHRFINSILNMGELPQQWKGPIIVPLLKRGDKTDSINCRGMSCLPIFLSQD